MNYAIVANGKVVNVAVSDTALADNWIPAGGAGIGWTWDGSTFTPPPAPEPEPDYDAELATAIDGATTLEELKAALVGNLTGAKSRVRGAPK